MTEIIDRVAAAIHKHVWPLECPAIEDLVDAARAAIEAMREPTDAMLAPFYETTELGRGDALVVWDTMIRKALSSSPKGGSHET